MAVRRKYTEEMLREAVAASRAVSEVLRFLGIPQAGGNHAHISRMIKRMEIDTSHFRPYRVYGGNAVKRPASYYLVRSDPMGRRQAAHTLRRSLLEIGRKYECAICGNDGQWLGKEIVLHVDHIDGEYSNNLPENLRFLCPNCHAQTPNFAGRGKGIRARRVADT